MRSSRTLPPRASIGRVRKRVGAHTDRRAIRLTEHADASENPARPAVRTARPKMLLSRQDALAGTGPREDGLRPPPRRDLMLVVVRSGSRPRIQAR